MALSEFRRHKFTTFFHHLDLDDDGAITEIDFDRYAVRIRAEKGWTDDSAELARLRSATGSWWDEMSARADDGDGRVSLDEFLAFLESVGDQTAATGFPPSWAAELCASTHALLDLSGNGRVDADEYSVWLRAIGSNADPAEAFARIDLNGDGVVTLPELFQLFAEFVMSEDPSAPGNYVMTGAL